MACKGDRALRPLLAFTPVPVAYPEYDLETRTFDNNKQGWSIGLFGCDNMHDFGINCFCAHCCCFQLVTWSNASLYMGIDSRRAAFAAGVSQLDLGDNQAAQTVQSFAWIYSIVEGLRSRRKLVRALALNDTGIQNLLFRVFCASCVQCQEVDTVMVFYKDSLGYRDIQYGNCSCCECFEFYATQDGKLRRIPYPNQKSGTYPNYPANGPGRNGYTFVGGFPVPANKEMDRT